MKYLAQEKLARSCRLKIDFDPTWVDYNPSIVLWRGEMLCSFRVSTVTCCDCGYWILPPHRRQDNRVMLGFLNRDFKVIRQHTLPTGNLPLAFGSFPFGWEDLRLYTSPSGSLQGLGCCRSADYERAHIISVDFADDLTIANVVSYPSPFDCPVEKNWVPFTCGQDTYVVYHWDPFSVRKLNADGTTEPVPQVGPPISLPGWRGSSQGLKTDDGWLFVVHRRAFRGRYKIYTLDYTHRMIELGHDFVPRRISEEFRFISPGIEFCGGLARSGDDFLFSVGKHDGTSHLVSLSVQAVEKMLVPFTDRTLPLRELPSVLTDDHIHEYQKRMVPPTLRSLVREAYLTANHHLRCVPRLKR